MAIGVLLIVAAVVVQLALVPSLRQLPADTDVTRTYSGTAAQLLDADLLESGALAAGDVASLFLTDQAVALSRHVTVQEVQDGTALVVEESGATLADGTPVAGGVDTYAVDRRTMAHEAASDVAFEDADVPAREGLVIGFPIGTEAEDQIGWSDDVQATVPLVHTGEATVEGLDVLTFTSEIPPTPISDPALLAQLPAAIPKPLLIQLFTASPDDLPIPADQALAVVAALPDPVPLSYTYAGETTYWVEPESGIVVDLARSEVRQAVIAVEGMPDPVPLAAVLDWTYEQTPDSVTAAVADAEEARTQLNLVGTVLPLTLYGLGAVLVLIGLLMARTGRRPRADEPTPPTEIVLDEHADARPAR